MPWQKAGLKGNEIDRTSTEYAKIIGKGKKNAVKLNCLYTLYIRTSRISNRSRLLETAVSLSIFTKLLLCVRSRKETALVWPQNRDLTESRLCLLVSHIGERMSQQAIVQLIGDPRYLRF